MFFYHDTDGGFRMLDGDRIAVLCAVFLNELTAAAGLELNLGVVQTAYVSRPLTLRRCIGVCTVTAGARERESERAR